MGYRMALHTICSIGRVLIITTLLVYIIYEKNYRLPLPAKNVHYST